MGIFEMIPITPIREFTTKYIPPEVQGEFNKTKRALILLALFIGMLVELEIVYVLGYFGVI